MAVDPYILLQGRVPDAVGAFGRGYGLGQEIKEAPLRNRLLEQQVEAGDAQNRARIDTDEIRSVVLGAERVRPFIERGDLEGAKRYLQNRIAIGPQSESGQVNGMVDTQEFLDQINSGVTPEQLLSQLDQVRELGTRFGVYSGSADQGMFAPMPAFDAQGIPVFVQGSRTGGLTQIDGFRPYTPTLSEKTAAEVGAYGQKQNIKAATEPSIAGASRQQELLAEQGLKPAVESAVATARGEAEIATDAKKGVSDRQSGYIEAGIAAAEQLPNYKRMRDLLANISTGDLASKSQAIANIFGRASADYQELDTMMKQAIIANIRSFGANPTEGERKFLMESTGDIRQSKDTLLRLFDKYEEKAKTSRDRGLRLAKQRGDQDAVDLINGVDKQEPTRYRFNPQTGRLE